MPGCITLKTTAIAYGQNLARSLKILLICNSSRFYKRQAIGSIVIDTTSSLLMPSRSGHLHGQGFKLGLP